MSANLNDLSEEAINQLVFASSEFDEPRGLLDVFTEEEVLSLPQHPRWHWFTEAFREWVNATIDNIMLNQIRAANNNYNNKTQ